MSTQERERYIDLQHSSLIDDPYTTYNKVRDMSPVYWNGNKELWYITGHPELTAFLKDDRFSSEYYLENKDHTKNLSEAGMELRRKTYMGGNTLSTYYGGRSLSATIGELHSSRRRALMPFFAASNVRKLRESVQAVVEQLLDEMENKDEVEFIRDFAYALPVKFIQVLLGIPDDQAGPYLDYDEFETARRVKSGVGTDADYEVVASTGQKYADLITDLIREKRENPDGSIVTEVLKAVEKPRAYSEADQYAELYMFIHSGHSTTTAYLGNLVYYLLHFDVWEQVRDNPDLIPLAIDEVLRWDPPQHITGRVATEDMEFFGSRIRKGDVCLGLPGAANRDPRVFDRPDEFIVDRSPNPHLSFGLARYLCIGAPYARVEGELMLKTLFRRFPNLKLAGPAENSHCIGFGLSKLPISLHG